ncbi:unnamed protein product [Rotaria sp. Silwood1]|nr:unnamed protein product [Rotaria sp. Silwood1]CAF3409877.1 unnamed protein product [Rotaria sp. Silwood1]CAF4645375.1 unnamed protein product [Rotaria sp. Silwood1]
MHRIDWFQLPKPLPSNLFDKYTHQSILPPLISLDIDELLWNQCRSFALNLGKKGFIDPLSILYTSFKYLYPNCSSIRSFTRWLILYEKDNDDFKNYFKQYSLFTPNIQSIGEIIRLIKTLQINNNNNISKPYEYFKQIWFFFSISIRLSIADCTLIADTLIIDDGVTRLSSKQKKTASTRIHCLFALTPSGKFSNQLIICKQGKGLKMNFNSSTFTRIIQTTTGDITHEHIQQWLEDFISSSYGTSQSAILFDPRTTLLTPEFENLCQKSKIELITIDLNYYLIHILSPIFSLFDKQCAEVNRLDKMYLKSAYDLQRIIHTIWYSLRTLKQNEQICQIFKQTFLWKHDDELYLQSLRSIPRSSLPKKKKKKTLVKTGSKGKLSSSTMMTDPPSDSTPEQILSYVIQRQLSILRASKFLGGMKLDYLKYCLSYKSNSSLMTGSRLLQLNTFMQSQSTIDWLRHLRSLYYWPCAKQLFLREIYQLTGIITRKRSMNMCGNGHMGSIRSCDLQSPGSFWRAFEDIHHIQFDNESIIDHDKWHNDFQQYLIDNKLNNEKTQLWTVDTFEFPLTKKSTVLQLPEWNGLRPMNLTPKVTVIYAFSNTGQSIEPYFIFPISLRDNTLINEEDSFNELGHLTPQIFLSWIENNLNEKNHSPIVLVFCSRLPVLSSMVLTSLEKYQIYPYGYPYTRTLPFRYLFERRVRNNRSTNLMSELWKKKLLDEQRTHVLKSLNCTVKNIKYYFQQIWSQIIYEKRDDDENDEHKTYEDKCQQAFQQANIQIKFHMNNTHNTNNKKKNTIKLTPKKNSKKIIQSFNHLSTELNESTTNNDEIVDQLNHLLTIICQFKEQITSANLSQILKMKNHVQQTTDFQLSANLNGTMDNTENVHPPSTSSEPTPSTNSIIPSTSDKRSIDENDQPHIAKRLRSSCSQASNNVNTTTTTTTTGIKWIPPSKQLVTHLQSQSSSLFQFTLSLIHTIFTSTDNHLTDEHSRWLHSTLNLYDHNYNSEKINVLIETACKVAKISLVR